MAIVWILEELFLQGILHYNDGRLELFIQHAFVFLFAKDVSVILRNQHTVSLNLTDSTKEFHGMEYFFFTIQLVAIFPRGNV